MFGKKRNKDEVKSGKPKTGQPSAKDGKPKTTVVLQPPNRYIKSKPFHFPHCRNFFMSSFMYFYVVLYCVSRETMV